MTGASSDREGQRFGRYELGPLLGEGGMGTVYRAYDPDLGRDVAVKLIRGQSERGHARLLREAQAMARLSHPHVASVFDVGAARGQVFVAMELIEGPTLRDWLRAQARSWREVLVRFIEAGRGLEAAHEAGLVHRDFKPSNVLIRPDGTAVVTDFGLARPTPRDAASDVADGETDDSSLVARPILLDDELTMTGAVVGTPRYMSPEQRAGEHVGAASDQFSFCLALWHSLAPQVEDDATRGHGAAEASRAGTASPVGAPATATETASATASRVRVRSDAGAELAQGRDDGGARHRQTATASGSMSAVSAVAPSDRAGDGSDAQACESGAELSAELSAEPAGAEPSAADGPTASSGNAPAPAEPVAASRAVALATGTGVPAVVRGTALPAVPARLRRALQRGLAERPEDRFASMTELLRELERDPERTRRRVLAVLAAAVVPAVAVGLLVRGPAGPACDQGAARMAALWSEPAKDSAQALLATSAYGKSAFDKASAGLDDYTSRWAQSFDGMCKTHRDGEMSAELFDRSIHCLERRHAELAAAVDLLAAETVEPHGGGGGDREAADLVRLVADLSPLGPCSDREALLANEPLPDDPAARRRFTELEHQVDELRARVNAGLHSDVGERVARIVAEARELNAPRLVAEARLLEGRVQIFTGLLSESLAVLSEAKLAAIRAARPELAGEAVARLLYSRVHSGGDVGDEFIDEQRALGDAFAQDSPAVLALLYNNVGASFRARKRLRAARQWYEKAEVERQKLADGGSVELSNIQINLALLLEEEREQLAALDRAIAARTRQLGRLHPRTLEVRMLEAGLISSPARALQAFEAVCDLLEEYHPHLAGPRATCAARVAALRDEGGLDGARERYIEAAELQEAAGNASGALHLRAHAARLGGDLDRAEELFTRIAETLGGEPGQPFWVLASRADAHIGLARVELARGRDDRARRSAELAIRDYQAALDGKRSTRLSRRLAWAKFYAALAAAKSDPKQAQAWFTEAAAWHRAAGDASELASRQSEFERRLAR